MACTATPLDNGLGNTINISDYQYTGNLWDAMASAFNLPDEGEGNQAVRKQIHWYVDRPTYIQQIAEKARPYLYYIFQQVRLKGLPAELALLPMVESNYDPFAYSKVGAAGLWQMMPGTASGFGLKVNWWYDGRRDIVASTESALSYFIHLNKFFHGDWLLSIAAYDTGEGTVKAAMQYNIKHSKSTNFWNLPLPKETKGYVPKLLAIATIIKNREEYGIKLPAIPSAPYLTKVDAGSQIDLALAARMSGMGLKELSKLNPGFNRWATDPDGPFELLLPVDKAGRFKEQLGKLPKQKRTTWLRYTVKSGDVLGRIANHYKTTVALLKRINHLKNSFIRPKQILLIPMKTSKLSRLVLHSEQHYLPTNHSIPEIKITNHVVRSGESLWSLAKKYRVSVRDICFWNGIKSKKAVKPGTKLIIWPRHKHTYQVVNRMKHRVKSGESLSVIAHRYHVSVSQLKKDNHLKNNFIRVGQLLAINHVEYQSKLPAKPKEIIRRIVRNLGSK